MKQILLLLSILLSSNIIAQVSLIDEKMKAFEVKGFKFGLKEEDFQELYSDAKIVEQSYDIVKYKYAHQKQGVIDCTFEREKLLNATIGFSAYGDEVDNLINALEIYFDGYKGDNVDLGNLYGKSWFSTDSIRVITLIYDDLKDRVLIYLEELKPGLYLMQEKFEINKFEISVEDVLYRKNISNDFFNETADGIFACIDIEITNLANKNKMLDDLNIFLVLLINDIEYKYEPSFDPTYIINSAPKRFLLGMDAIPPLIPIKTTLVFEIPSEKYIMFLSLRDKNMEERRCAVRIKK